MSRIAAALGIKQSAQGADHEGSMVALYLPSGLAHDLAIEGGEPPQDLHITLAYFVDKAVARDDWGVAANVTQRVSGTHAPLQGSISGNGSFDTPTGVVCWAAVDLPGIVELHTDLVGALQAAGFPVSQQFEFTPHITLTYLDQAPETHPLQVLEPLPMTLSELTLAVGDHHQQFPFGASQWSFEQAV